MRTAASVQSTRRARTVSVLGEFARLARRASAARVVDLSAYRGRPVEFQREVCGYDPIGPQVQVFEALERRGRCTVPSGRAMGKSRLDAGAALYFAATRPRSCVVLIAPTFKQIQKILWEELRLLYYATKVPLGGECALLASTGARLGNGSRIFGITGTQPEDVAGIRAPEMLVLADEASGIPDPTFDTLDGNLAGGGWMLLTGNPTRASGYFREACRSERWDRVHLPSTSSPNVMEGRIVVPGIATLDWVEARRQEWGEDSPLYKIHVLGEFVELEEGRLFSEALIAEAEDRWSEVQPTGRLVIGLDPAGESGDGDESAFACRRGKKVLKLHAKRGLTADGHVTEALGLARELLGGERPTAATRPLIVVDRDGYVGAKVYAALAAYQSQHEDAYELRGVRGGERAKRQPLQIDRVRDEVWLALVDAMRDGLAIPEDVKLTRELAAIGLERHVSGRSKVTSKDDLRRELGRSPDRADALALCAAIEASLDEPEGSAGPSNHAPDPYDAEPERIIDPYSALERWRS
jgi:phage terminase large subunit